MSPIRVTLWVFVSCVVVGVVLSRTDATRDDLLETLSGLIEQEQMTETVGVPGQFTELEGIYRNYLRLNTRGKCEQSILRLAVKIPSINSFISEHVAILILDAFRFGQSPQPSQKSIERIVQVFERFHDKNDPFNTPFMSFFPQVYDEEHDFWFQAWDLSGVNVQGISSQKQLSELLLGDNLPPDLGKMVPPVYMPPDFDILGSHLSFGASLYDLRDDFPEASSKWNRDNTNITSAFDSAKQYAYRPFSEDPDSSLIDPRSYYVYRNFIDEAKGQGRDLVILNTWAATIGESRRLHNEGKKKDLPRSCNILDVAVMANYFAGVISSVTYGLIEPQVINSDDDFNVLLDSSGDAVVHLLRNNFADRIDLSLVYYTSPMQVYWFIGRGLMLMENAKQRGRLPVEAFERYYQKLSNLMRNESTVRILDLRTIGSDGDIYYDEFLGNADLSYYDKPIKRYEDRIFTTSMAINSLLAIWSVHDNVNGLRWMNGTPDLVKDTVYGCARWLEANTLSGEYSASCAFFTRDTKNFESLPYWYPANRFEYFNGTKIKDFTYIPYEKSTFGVQGYVEPDDYEKILKVDQFGVPTPEKFKGFNNSTGSTIFWSSEALTHASVMMAISMVEQVYMS